MFFCEAVIVVFVPEKLFGFVLFCFVLFFFCFGKLGVKAFTALIFVCFGDLTHHSGDLSRKMGFFDPLFDASNVDSLPLSSGLSVAVISVGYLVAMSVTTLLAPKKPLELRMTSLVGGKLAIV